MFKKVYAYEICEGDKGIIIARSYKQAQKILKKEYDINATDDEEKYWNGEGAYLYEVGNVKNNCLYDTFEG